MDATSSTTPSRPVIYGLDIETDTTIDGLDPVVARIVAVAVAGADGAHVFDDSDEALLLDRLDWHLAALDPGVIATWNGAAFDLPFLADRFRRHGLAPGLRLAPDPSIRLRGEPLPGHRGAYRARWHQHAHLDAYRVFRADVVPALGVSGGLKAMARLCGLDPVEVVTSRLHELTPGDIRAYVASDARCTRELIARRWRSARTAVDRVPDRPDHALAARGGAARAEAVG